MVKINESNTRLEVLIDDSDIQTRDAVAIRCVVSTDELRLCSKCSDLSRCTDW